MLYKKYKKFLNKFKSADRIAREENTQKEEIKELLYKIVTDNLNSNEFKFEYLGKEDNLYAKFISKYTIDCKLDGYLGSEIVIRLPLYAFMWESIPTHIEEIDISRKVKFMMDKLESRDITVVIVLSFSRASLVGEVNNGIIYYDTSIRRLDIGTHSKTEESILSYQIETTYKNLINDIREKSNLDWNKVKTSLESVLRKRKEEKERANRIESLWAELVKMSDDVRDYLIDLEDISKKYQIEQKKNMGSIYFKYTIPELVVEDDEVVLNDKYVDVINILKKFNSRWKEEKTIVTYKIGSGHIVIKLKSNEIAEYYQKKMRLIRRR